MAPLWMALCVMEAALISAGLGFCLLVRNRRLDDVVNDPSHVNDVASLQKSSYSSTAGTELGVSSHDTEQPSTSGYVSPVSGHEFEVFLSFRGAEIRKTFVDCLYHDLIGVGVRAFRDNEELRVGKEIGPDLMRAIEQSKIWIPIFTRDYASSKWCLREVAEMVKCMKDPGCKQHIIPIFFDVTPDQVQHQSGTYAEAFARHEKKFDPETVKGWRDALKEVVKLKGLELDKAAKGNQGEFIKLVAAEVLRELRQAQVDGGEILVGLDDHAEKVMQMLEVGINDVRMVGIWGTGGIGKTTLSKCVYNRIAHQFECCSFLSDIRETSGKPGGLVKLQHQLVSDILGQQKYRLANTDYGINVLKSRLRGKKSLILLDDIDHINQLKALAANLDWFGSGTRILITTREKGVLLQFPSCKIYEHQLLDEGHALELFRQYAFRDDSQSAGEYDDFSRDVVSITRRLPLALVVIGSFLFASRGKKDIWQDTIEQLKRKPDMHVQEKLKVSYDALTPEQQEIFLDIACFFIGEDVELIVPMWGDCNYFPRLGIEVLQLKSLIKIGYNNQLQMHDQIRDLGRHIVEQENYREPELRSRLWRSKDAIDILRAEQGTSKIEAVEIWPGKEERVCFSDKCFKNLSRLRILRLRGGVQIGGDFQHLLPKLRWLRWSARNMPPPSNLPLKNLTVLCLSSSGVDEDWDGWNSIKMERLKVLDISHCSRLRRTPDFSTFPNLERLNLEGCSNLASIHQSIHQSIGLLNNLNSLNLRYCGKLKELPNQLGYLEALTVLFLDFSAIEEIPVSGRMKKLETLSANSCDNLNHIPREIGSLVSLERLSLEGFSNLRELPDTIGQLKSLVELRLQNCGIRFLPKTLQNLKELQVIDTRGCFFLKGEVPVDIRNVSLLRVLTLHLGDVERSPASLSGLSHLETLRLDLGRGWSLETLHGLPSGLISLTVEGSSTYLTEGGKELDFCGDHMKLREDWLGQLCKLEILVLRSVNIKDLPESIGSFSCLKKIDISECTKLEHLPTLPSGVRSLSICDCRSLWMLPTLSNLRRLTELHVRNTGLRKIDGLGGLTSLQKLSIRDCPSTMLDGVEKIESLHELSITSCDVKRLPDLSNLQRLRRLYASGNRHLVNVQGINKLTKVESVNFSNCTALERPDGVEMLGSLKYLDISECNAIVKLPNLSRLHNLSKLNAKGCEKLQHVEGLPELVSLSTLDISGCKAIEELPNLSKLQNLGRLYVGGIQKLQQLESIRELGSLEVLDISGCKEIVKLPDLSKLQRLRRVSMRGCEKLTRLDGLEELINLEDLIISGCNAIENLSDLSKLQRLRKLEMEAWEKPEQIDGLEELESLEELSLRGSTTIKSLPDLSKSTRLAVLHMVNCENLSQLDNLEKLRSLERLDISGCKAIDKLPELSKLKSLRHLNMGGCKLSINLEQIGELCSNEELEIDWCEPVEKLPELSKLQSLQHLNMRGFGKLIQLDGIWQLVSLKQLDLTDRNEIEKLPELSNLQTLRRLTTRGCEKLVQLDGVEELASLKKLDVSECRLIEKLPDLSKLHCLQRLNVGGCKKLKQLDGIEELVSLKKLDISGCTSIEELPKLLKLQSLQHLIMRGCKKLKNLDGIRDLASLEQLDISWCRAIEKLPDVSALLKLRQLNMRGCEKLTRLDGIEELVSLKQLDISGCKAIEKLPNLSKLKSLWHLNMRGCQKLSGLDGLEQLESLEEVALSRLKSIENLPNLTKLRKLRWLEVKSCEKLRKLDGLEELEALEHLAINRCRNIEKLPDLSKLQSLYSLQVEVWENSHQLDVLKEMGSLRKLDISGSIAIEKLPELSKHYHLSHLYMRGCKKLSQLDGLAELVSLEELDVSCCTAIESLPDLSKLQRLKILKAKACTKLIKLGGLGNLTSLEKLDISGCTAIEKLPVLSQLHSLQDLRMGGCGKLRQLDGIQELKSLMVLRVSGCKGIEKLPDLSKLQYLLDLDVKGCKKLRQLEGLEELKFLAELNISGCKAIEKLPDSSKLQRLEKLKMEGCKNIRNVQGLEKFSELKVLCISGCKLLTLPDLSHLKDLRIRKGSHGNQLEEGVNYK